MSRYFFISLKTVLCVANFQLLIHLTAAFDPKAFDDSILYKLNWPGDVYAGVFDENGILINSDLKEKFKCILPEIKEKSNEEVEKYAGPNPLDLLKPLFQVTRCSYKLGSYWTYEICHGTHVRQYHEDREMKTPKGQEYKLGQWDTNAVTKLREELEEVDENGEKKFLSKKLPVIKIENLKLPYLRINMTGGTFCELSKKPRVTYVLYVCYKHGKHEVYSFKEISTCEYETVVLSPLLCSHPMFRPHITSEKNINCYPMPGGTAKPRSLYKLEQESAELRQSRALGDTSKKTVAVFSVKTEEDGRRKVQVEIIPMDTDNEEGDKIRHAGFQVQQKAMTPVEDFLSGRECLYGGSSWWKFEFCYGRSVKQYHEEKDGSRTTVQLGFFNKEDHRDWLAKYPIKRPLPVEQRKQVSHLYTGGDICDITGLPRQTEVRLKCADPKTSASAVILSMLEPRTCEYVLSVESPVICELLPRADKDGLFLEKLEDEIDVTIEVDDSMFAQTDTTTLPISASGPPLSGFGSTISDKKTGRPKRPADFSSERKKASGTVNAEEEGETNDDTVKSASSQDRGDSGSGSEPRTFKPLGRREGRTSLNDEL